jgi:hypothetical protein
MFMGPFDQFISRNTNGLKGVKKFIDKVVALWDKVTPFEKGEAEPKAEQGDFVRISGKTYQVLAKARYTTRDGSDEYIKIFLSDNSALVYLQD